MNQTRLMNNNLKYIFTLFLIGFLNQTNAQIKLEITQVKKHAISGEVGLNATNFIRQFVVFNSNNLNLPLSPYAVNGKIFYGKTDNKFGVRIGLGYTFIENSNTNNNSVNDFITKTESKDYRIGVEYQQKISSKFKLFYGLDYQRHGSKDKTVSTFINGNNISVATNEFFNRARGMAAVVGVQYNINKYLNLHTETRIGYKTGEGGSKQTNSANPQFDRVEANGLRAAIFDLPAFINLNIMF